MLLTVVIATDFISALIALSLVYYLVILDSYKTFEFTDIKPNPINERDKVYNLTVNACYLSLISLMLYFPVDKMIWV